ncbi:type II toxin-antitoxin system RelE/ParE family toxin [bacterium]|nr:type II toxin-antitoxin system RelE/ParE family toxin [bacterium]
MNIKYELSFEKDLKKIKNKSIKNIVKNKIESIKKTKDIASISGLKKLKGYENYYRIRISDHRIGIEIKEDTMIFVRILNRKDIYRYFP